VFRFFSARERISQRRFPPEFRIPGHGWPPERALHPPRSSPSPPAELAEPAETVGDLADSVMADVVTNLWRTTRKIGTGGESDVLRPQRQAARHLRAVWDRLSEAGVEVQDHDGLSFDPGLSLDVVAYEVHPGISKETVLETVQPSVYRSGRCIQVGKVIVAQPEEGQDHGTRDD
jgi:hypothetical protein